jgi:hypothetical protein
VTEAMHQANRAIKITRSAFSLAIAINIFVIWGCTVYHYGKTIDIKTLDTSKHSIVIGHISGTGSNNHWILSTEPSSETLTEREKEGKAFELIETKESHPNTPWFKRLYSLLERGYFFIAVPPDDYILCISVNPNTLLNPYKFRGAFDCPIHLNVPSGSLINLGTITLVPEGTEVTERGLKSVMTIKYHYQTKTGFDEPELYFKELYPHLYNIYYPKLIRIQ